MAPITKTIVLAALAAMVSARPLVVRAPSPDLVTETAWTTVDVPVTLWVNSLGQPVSTEVPGGNFVAVPTTPSAAPTVTSTPTPVAPAPVAPTVSTTVATTTSLQPVATSTTTPAPAPVAVSSSPAPVASSSAPAASSPAPVSGGAAGGSTSDAGIEAIASSTNTCEGSGQACQGDITYYSGGLGACGWNVDTNSDMQIALPFEFMGTASNNNPYCGKSLTILNPTTGQTIQATVGDKCMGCSGRSIDLTEALFNAIGSECNGRCHGFDWWFN